MKVFVTPNSVLTTGIRELEVTESDTVSGMVMAEGAGAWNQEYFHKIGRDWHKTREAAVKRAEEMRCKKIQSLQKQIAGLNDLRFQ